MIPTEIALPEDTAISPAEWKRFADSAGKNVLRGCNRNAPDRTRFYSGVMIDITDGNVTSGIEFTMLFVVDSEPGPDLRLIQIVKWPNEHPPMHDVQRLLHSRSSFFFINSRDIYYPLLPPAILRITDFHRSLHALSNIG